MEINLFIIFLWGFLVGYCVGAAASALTIWESGAMGQIKRFWIQHLPTIFVLCILAAILFYLKME